MIVSPEQHGTTRYGIEIDGEYTYLAWIIPALSMNICMMITMGIVITRIELVIANQSKLVRQR